MRPPFRATVLFVCLLTAPALRAQLWNLQFGQSFPLTNTRYGEIATQQSVLLSNDTGVYLFWLSVEGVRATKLGASEPTSGRMVLESLRPFEAQRRVFDVIWTGTHFLVAATTFDGAKDSIMGQLLDAKAEVIGEPLTLVDNGSSPTLASSTSSILLVYSAGRPRARLLTSSGAATAVDRSLGDASSARYDVASNGSGFAVVVSGMGRRETTMLDRDGAITAQISTSMNDEEIALASDGGDYLLVTTGSNATNAHFLRASGAIDRHIQLAAASFATPAAAWNDDRYVVAFVAAFPRELRVVQLDREARGVVGQESKSVLAASSPAITAHSGRVHLAYGTSPLLVSELPLATHLASPATYTAMNQRLLAAASSSDATLVIWEEGDLRVGIRHRDGRWREMALDGVQSAFAVAGSDGSGFVAFAAVEDNAAKTVAVRFDANGTPLSPRTPMPFKPTDVVWTGQAYAVIGVAPNGVMALYLTPSGIATMPVLVRGNDVPDRPIQRAAIAMNGNELISVWAMPTADVEPQDVDSTTIRGVLLNEELQRIGLDDILLSEELAGWPDVAVRNGVVQFVFAHGPTVYERSMHEGILGSTTPVFTGVHDQTDVRLEVIANTAVVSWLDSFSPSNVGAVHRIRTDYVTTSFRSALPTAPLTVALPGAAVAYLGASTLTAAPHYGSTRITMAIADVIAVPRVTEAPVATARKENDAMRIDWSGPAQHVDGYRVEYRIADGPWHEIERWFDPTERTMTFRPLRSGEVYSFRVRAWSAGGTGPYSNVAVAPTGRRRAVR